jgi:outer membrane protein
MFLRGENLMLIQSAIRWLGMTVMFVVLSLLPQNSGAQEKPTLLTLEKAIQLALERNLELKVAQEEIVAAQEQRNQAMTDFLPKLKAEYGYRRPSENVSTVGGVSVQAADRNQFRFTGTLEQPVFTGFATLTTYQLSKLGLDVARVQYERARLDLILQVKESYYGILRAEKLREVAMESVRELKEGVRVAENFYKVGMSPKVDVLDAETRLGEAELQLIVAINDLRVEEARFNTILRQPIDTPVEVEDILSTMPYEKTYQDSQEIAVKYRPELLEAAKNVASAEKEITLTKSDYYPTVTFSSNYYRHGNEFDVQGSNYLDRESWDIIAVANWTFFEWGKTRYAANEKRVRLQQALEAQEQVKDSVSLEVKTSYLTVQAAERAITVAEKNVESAEENFRISTERYREQVATSTEVLDAQTRLTEARTGYTNALVAFNLARARLIRAMGLDEETILKELEGK